MCNGAGAQAAEPTTLDTGSSLRYEGQSMALVSACPDLRALWASSVYGHLHP